MKYSEGLFTQNRGREIDVNPVLTRLGAVCQAHRVMHVWGALFKCKPSSSSWIRKSAVADQPISINNLTTVRYTDKAYITHTTKVVVHFSNGDVRFRLLCHLATETTASFKEIIENSRSIRVCRKTPIEFYRQTDVGLAFSLLLLLFIIFIIFR